MTDREIIYYLRYRTRKEYKDATLLAARGLFWTFILLLLSTSLFGVKVYLIAFIFFVTMTVKNIYVIYFKYSPKYQHGNSYVKRKWKVPGGIINIYCTLATFLIYLKVEEQDPVTMILFYIFFPVLIVTHRGLVNIVWYKIDKKYYSEIDKHNPYQKKYLLEPKRYWKSINNNERTG